MDPDPTADKPAGIKAHVDHWKWLVGVLGGLMLTLQGFSWIESRIERRVEERVMTATAISRLDNSGKESKTWMDGRINTLSAEVEALRREIGILRADVRSNSVNIRSTVEAATPSPTTATNPIK